MSDKIILQANVSQVSGEEGEDIPAFLGTPVHVPSRNPLGMGQAAVGASCVEAVVIAPLWAVPKNGNVSNGKWVTGIYVYDHHDRAMLVDVQYDVPTYAAINLN